MDVLESPEMETFNKALASVLAASRSEVQDKIAQAKGEKPSPHTKYKYVPEADPA